MRGSFRLPSIITSKCLLKSKRWARAEEVLLEWEDSDHLLDESFTHAGLSCVYLKGSANEYYWELFLMQLL